MARKAEATYNPGNGAEYRVIVTEDGYAVQSCEGNLDWSTRSVTNSMELAKRNMFTLDMERCNARVKALLNESSL